MATIAYLAVIEKDQAGGWSGYVPDLPGCSAAAGSHDDLVHLLREKAAQHLADLAADHQGVPVPTCEVERLLVPLPGHAAD